MSQDEEQRSDLLSRPSSPALTNPSDTAPPSALAIRTESDTQLVAVSDTPPLQLLEDDVLELHPCQADVDCLEATMTSSAPQPPDPSPGQSAAAGSSPRQPP